METGLQLRTDTMGELTLIEGEGGPGQTALGVLADLVAIAREKRCNPFAVAGEGEHRGAGYPSDLAVINGSETAGRANGDPSAV